MPRQVFHASLLHISPQTIGWKIRSDRYRHFLAWTPFKEGILLQCDKGQKRYEGELETCFQPIFKLAPCGTTHLFLHVDGPVLPLHLYDRDAVLSAYNEPPFLLHCDDSEFAESGCQKLSEDQTFDGSPMYFERMASYYEIQFRRLVKDRDDNSLEEIVDAAYNLACGVECMKLNTQNFWTRCDAAIKAMGEAMDQVLDSFEEKYSTDLQYLENVLLGARSRVCRSLRVSDSWRRDNNWRNVAGV